MRNAYQEKFSQRYVVYSPVETAHLKRALAARGRAACPRCETPLVGVSARRMAVTCELCRRIWIPDHSWEALADVESTEKSRVQARFKG